MCSRQSRTIYGEEKNIATKEMSSYDSSSNTTLKRLRHPMYDEQNGIAGIRRPIKTHTELLQFVAAIKVHDSRTRRDIKQLVAIASDDGISIDVDAALDLTVKIMFTIGCRSSFDMITTGHVCRPTWKESESLDAFIGRILPRHEIEPVVEKAETIRTSSLSEGICQHQHLIDKQPTRPFISPDHR